MMIKLLTRLTDALKEAWKHKWSQSAINERLDRPDGSGNRPLWTSRMRGPARAVHSWRPPSTDAEDAEEVPATRPRRWSTQALNERLDAASRKRRP